MAEAQSQEKTEQATPKRLLDAKKKGQVPRSKELNTVSSLLAAGFGMLFFGQRIVEQINLQLVQNLSFSREAIFVDSFLVTRLGETVIASVMMLLPLFGLLVLATIMSPFSMGGWVFNASLLAPKLERISLIKGIGRLFSPKSLMELVKAIGKFVLVTATTCLVLYLVLDQILSLSLRPLQDALGTAGSLIVWCMLGFSSVLILVAAADVPFQIWQHRRQLRMTRQEVKDELKDTEGRPEVKSTIREKQQEFARQRMMTEVPNADVVITNPTHYAVALKYDQLATGAPKVVAKGQDLVAARIREIAEQNGVVLFAAPPLARALYFSTDLNQEIPRNLFLAVAQVMAYVFQLRQVKKHGGQKPKPPKDLQIPEEYDESETRAD
ncbi:MAG: flagellar biosynthesis protein FlhB [Gammaproteobacteria bacterium]|nr:flagellar biosynthesis protein FlhB [Gammaproteobacteria bacterium]